MNKTISTLTILSIICLLALGIPSIVEGLAPDRHYVLYSGTTFMVLFVEDEQLKVIDGGTFYKNSWQLIDLETVHVDIVDPENKTYKTKNEYDAVWITANLESGERFWLTYTILNDAVKVSGVFVYDEKTLQEDYTLMNLSRLLY